VGLSAKLWVGNVSRLEKASRLIIFCPYEVYISRRI
jgi:hypothetical protein